MLAYANTNTGINIVKNGVFRMKMKIVPFYTILIDIYNVMINMIYYIL